MDSRLNTLSDRDGYDNQEGKHLGYPAEWREEYAAEAAGRNLGARQPEAREWTLQAKQEMAKARL